MSPDLRAYGRGMQDARGRPGVEAVDTTSSPQLSQQYVEGWQAGRPSPQRSTLRGEPSTAPALQAGPSPAVQQPLAQSPQAVPRAPRQSNPSSQPKTKRFSNPDKMEVHRRMAEEGADAKSFATAAEQKYALKLEDHASKLGMSVKDLWTKLFKGENPRKNPLAIGLIAGSAATNAMMNDNRRENAMMKRGQ